VTPKLGCNEKDVVNAMQNRVGWLWCKRPLGTGLHHRVNEVTEDLEFELAGESLPARHGDRCLSRRCQSLGCCRRVPNRQTGKHRTDEVAEVLTSVDDEV